MELMQIIESSVSIFSLGLIVFMILSYLLFKVKNRSIGYPGQRKLFNTQVSIIYEKPPEIKKEETVKDIISKRFIVINDCIEQPSSGKAIRENHEANNRFYVYRSGTYKIVKGLELSKIKEY